MFSVKENDPVYPEALRLINFLRNFLPIPSEEVPKDSVPVSYTHLAGEVKYESNEAADITVDGDEYVEPSEPTTPKTQEETPSTGDTTEEVTNPDDVYKRQLL